MTLKQAVNSEILEVNASSQFGCFYGLWLKISHHFQYSEAPRRQGCFVWDILMGKYGRVFSGP